MKLPSKVTRVKRVWYLRSIGFEPFKEYPDEEIELYLSIRFGILEIGFTYCPERDIAEIYTGLHHARYVMETRTETVTYRQMAIIVKQLLNKRQGNKIKWQKSKKKMN